MHDFEKLGAFYLGRENSRSAEHREKEDGSASNAEPPFLYDSRDLLTHAVVVGMTGSGKTGLALALLEEAAIDGIPAIAIDPKGDLGNLLLTLPGLSAEEFRPWVDTGEAARRGLTPDAFAEETAKSWREGLAAWGQDGARIARLRAAVDLAIYTPGSSAGLPLSVLRSFAPPSSAANAAGNANAADDGDARRDRVASVVSGLLALVGREVDPLTSREHILLSTLLDSAWREGRALDLASIVAAIQSPPFDQIGVMSLETFYPAQERRALALALNGLLASPGFAAWREGEPLDIARLLHTAEGKPRVSILSIAHLSDQERMFFVTLLLGEILAWMRAQPGASSLRALLFMDEVFGFFPPTANPPSKGPMLTLLKQGRAFGLGVVLATQNPVDLDYKGLANTGSWFVGRLQTDRDQLRILDALEGAAAGVGAAFDRAATSALLAGLEKRRFLLHDIHRPAPVLFESRWAMSYLKGPLTRAEISRLSPRPVAAQSAASTQSAPSPPPLAPAAKPSAIAPQPAAGVPVYHLACDAPDVVYRAALHAVARLHYVRATNDVDTWEDLALLALLPDDDQPQLPAAIWEAARVYRPEALALCEGEPPTAQFASLVAAATKPRSIASWTRALAGYLYQSHPLTLWRNPASGEVSRPGESAGEFRVRAAQVLREARDKNVDRLRAKHATALARLDAQIARAQAMAERERDELAESQSRGAVDLGVAVLGAIFGRGSRGGAVGRAATAARGAARTRKASEDVGRADESVESLRARRAELMAVIEQEVAQLQSPGEAAQSLEAIEVRARKGDISVSPVGLVWTPWGRDSSGVLTPRF